MLNQKATMTSRLYKLVAGAAALLALIPSASAGTLDNINGAVLTPDSGASIVLLAIGCSGLAIAARKRFKR